MKMKLIIIEDVATFLERLPDKLHAKCLRHIELFEEFGFSLSSKDLKKLDKNLWELRPKNIRLFIGKIKKNIWAIHAFYKTTQKTPQKEITLANNRLKELK